MRVVRAVGRFAFGEGVTSALRWLTLYLLVLGLATAYGFHLITEGRHDACVARNESTADSVRVGAESLIQVAADADAQTVAQYRRILERNLAKVAVDC